MRFANIDGMKLTGRAHGDLVRYYRSKQGKLEVIALAGGLTGAIFGNRALAFFSLGLFGGVVYPLSMVEAWRRSERQAAEMRHLAERLASAERSGPGEGLDRIQDFETDVIMARARDLTRLDEIEDRLVHLESLRRL